MKILRSTLFLFLSLNIFAQTEAPDFDAVDSLYREDQFYISFTYNILTGKDLGISQNKFSAGLGIGFLRDMPLNKARTFAVAAGLGYAFQNYNQNLLISEIGNEAQYNLVVPGSGYDKNRLSLHFVELPIEFRWRTSTPESHKFWRVYTGIKFSYLFYDRSKFVGNEGEFIVTANDDLSKFRYGVYLATGYNTWNFHIYYGLNPIFKSAELNGEDIDLRTLNMGLMFYIL